MSIPISELERPPKVRFTCLKRASARVEVIKVACPGNRWPTVGARSQKLGPHTHTKLLFP